MRAERSSRDLAETDPTSSRDRRRRASWRGEKGACMTCGWRVPSGAPRGGRPPQHLAHQLPAALLPGGQGRGERGTGDREMGRPTSLHPPTLAGGAQEPRPEDVRAVPLLRLRLLHDAHADHAYGNVGQGARGRLPGIHRSWTGEALDEVRALAFSLRAARTSLPSPLSFSLSLSRPFWRPESSGCGLSTSTSSPSTI